MTVWFLLIVFVLLGWLIYIFYDQIKPNVTLDLILGIGIGMGIPPTISKIWEKIMKCI